MRMTAAWLYFSLVFSLFIFIPRPFRIRLFWRATPSLRPQPDPSPELRTTIPRAGSGLKRSKIYLRLEI